MQMLRAPGAVARPCCSSLTGLQPSARLSRSVLAPRHLRARTSQVVYAGENEPQQGTESKPQVPNAAPASSSSSGEPSGTSAQEELLKALPGAEKSLQIPPEVIEKLRYTVFGFDTFWVTSVENYEQEGVIFKGNVRGKSPEATYAKMKDRLKAELGDKYQLFLLQDKDEQPTVVVLPEGAGAERISRGTEIWLAIAFAVGTMLTTVNAASVPILQWLVDPFRTMITAQDVQEAIPSVVALWVVIILHEVGHWQAAKRAGAETYLPFVIPAGFGFIGSFGSITRLKGFLPDRASLLDFASSGPYYGAAASFALLLLGLGLSSVGLCDIGVDSPSFADSLLVAVAAQAFLGDKLAEPIVQVNSLFLAGWSGLIINALNCIPMGETDGGRMANALWGRRTGLFLGIWSTAALTLSSLQSALAFYWVVLVAVLQRGPVLPCNNELTPPKDEDKVKRAIALLFLPLLILLPYPVELIVALQNLGDPTPF